MFEGKSILVTVETGSFGKSFIRTLLAKHKPRRVAVYSRDELKQYEMQQEFGGPEMRYFIGDVRDRERLTMAMRGVDFVVHAAALKQVPAAEYNPIPVHGQGRQSDQPLQRDQALLGFSVVRYGNVVGSRGSVVPYFKKLIDSGADHLPITHEHMTRFWITLDQGVDFVCKSFERMKGGETFVPKIPPVRIMDLAKAMAPDLPHKIVGIRPGEKLHEVMCPRDDSHLTIEFADHYVIKPTIKFYSKCNKFLINKLNETGKPVDQGFEYNSGDNPHFLSVEEIRAVNHLAGF